MADGDTPFAIAVRGVSTGGGVTEISTSVEIPECVEVFILGKSTFEERGLTSLLDCGELDVGDGTAFLPNIEAIIDFRNLVLFSLRLAGT